MERRATPAGRRRQNIAFAKHPVRDTGQREAAESGLYFYGARWYRGAQRSTQSAAKGDPSLGRFTQADTIIPFPGNPMAWDRYAYVLNSPLRYTDPSGHVNIEGTGGGGLSEETLDYYWKSKATEIVTDYKKKQNEEGLTVFWGGLSDQEKYVLEKAGWNEITFEEGPGVTEADALHDPVVWLVVIVASSVGAPSLPIENYSTLESVNTGINVVYRYVEEGVVRYIGITNDPARRNAEHIRNRGWTINPIQGLQNLSRSDAKAVEQVLIESYGLDNLYNKINSISANNPIYQEAVQRGTEILRILGFDI